MKKIFRNVTTMLLAAIFAIPATAQLNGTGYYRFRNADRANEYISFANNLFDYVVIIDKAAGGFSNLSGDEGRARALTCASRYMQTDIHMIEDADLIDASTIIYAKKKTTNPSDYNYEMIGQSTSLLTLTTGSVSHSSFGSPTATFKDIYANIQKSGDSGESPLYTAYIPLTGTLTYFGVSTQQSLGNRYFIDDEGVFNIAESNSEINAKWYIEPVNRFNVKPEVAFNGKYYTSVCVPFAFSLAGQVLNAYAVTAINADGTLNYETVATTGGTVPSGTPVILECGSDNISECQLTLTGSAPRTDSNTDYSGTNLLKSTYFSNTDGEIHYDTSAGENKGSFNADNYTSTEGKFVLGITESGKLGFIPATGKAMPANKSWMENPCEFPWEVPVTVLIGDVNEDGAVSIKDVSPLIDYLLGEAPEVFNATNADIDENENINIKDLSLLIDMLLGGSNE